ncbi:MAG: radical SAM protein [Candidatus Riflebacteria bacterium]|nr:radical SAM protein [Candidatus Riflebacteria bacterium]
MTGGREGSLATLLAGLSGGGTTTGAVANLLERATRHPRELVRAVPTATLAVSVTGPVCHQRCTHCEGHYLRGMKTLADLGPAAVTAASSLLISGGSLSSGEVPLADHLDAILALPPDLPLNLHVGLQDGDRLAALRGRKVTVSFDLVGDDATAREVFRLDRPAADWWRAYEALQRLFPVIPHLTIGLRGGILSGERAVLRFLADRPPPPALTFLVFRPTPHTPLADRLPPAPLAAAELIAEAAGRLDCPLHLGCMRPAGDWRRRFDPLAWAAGARTIVMPDRRLVAALRQTGLPVRDHRECCSLPAREVTDAAS